MCEVRGSPPKQISFNEFSEYNIYTAIGLRNTKKKNKKTNQKLKNKKLFIRKKKSLSP